MKRVLFLAAFTAVAVMTAVSANAQTRTSTLPAAEDTQSVSFSVLGLHYGSEYSLARRFTLTGRVGVDGAVAWGYDLFGGNGTFWAIAPSIDIEPRFYYGLDRRAAHGRSTAGNSGSFLSLNVKTLLPVGYISSSDSRPTGATFLLPKWGLRRVWGKHWLFEFTAGAALGWGWEDREFMCTPAIGLRFGYTF